jgi:D-alanyl-D-alanine carboxypeptidase (penicillin-binding protein 5/6)
MNKKVQPAKPKGPAPIKIIAIALVVLLVLAYLIMTFMSSPKVVASVNQISTPEFAPSTIAWPAYGQAAVGADGFGVLATNGEQIAHPIASIAKLILAESVLKKYPLEAGQTGPEVTMTQQDVDFYNAALAAHGSLMPINFGESLSEYQMLQGLLIASGDNIADTLAVWAFGSTDNYIKYANQMVSDMGLTKTVVADASGLSPQTVSCAHDLVLLGENEINSPVLSDIVSQTKVTLPIAGTINNYDSLLGQNGVIGIKTGNTDEAGGCFLFAVKNPSTDPGPTIVGAILGAKNLSSVLSDTRTFIQANIANMRTIPVVKSGQVIGTYNAPWGQKVNAIATKDLSMFTINGDKISTNISLDPIKKSTLKDAGVGTFTATAGVSKETITTVLDSDISAPTFWWKLTHPFK